MTVTETNTLLEITMYQLRNLRSEIGSWNEKPIGGIPAYTAKVVNVRVRRDGGYWQVEREYEVSVPVRQDD